MRAAAKLIILLVFLCVGPVVSARDAGVQHAHSSPTIVEGPPASNAPASGWPTDAPLRAGMRRIRQSVEALDHYRHGHLGPDQAKLLAAEVEKDVGLLVATCKLEPAADAALHVIIGRLVSGARALERGPSQFAAIDLMQAAVEAYGRTFDDPGFAPKRAKPPSSAG